MTAYYNEIDPYAAQWLRNLIAAGHIAYGYVDERSISDVRPADLAGFTQCHFFAGIGVWSYALRRAGWPDNRPVWTGSCPCQPFSEVGAGEGFADERHLWPHWFHLISVCRPDRVAGEQVASKDGLGWLDLVSADMEGAQYAFGAFDLCAAGFGGAHNRPRLYFMGMEHAERAGLEGYAGNGGHREEPRRQPAEATGSASAPSVFDCAQWLSNGDGLLRPLEPGIVPVADEAPETVDRLRSYGNAIDAATAESFIAAYLEHELAAAHRGDVLIGHNRGPALEDVLG